MDQALVWRGWDDHAQRSFLDELSCIGTSTIIQGAHFKELDGRTQGINDDYDG